MTTTAPTWEDLKASEIRARLDRVLVDRPMPRRKPELIDLARELLGDDPTAKPQRDREPEVDGSTVEDYPRVVSLLRRVREDPALQTPHEAAWLREWIARADPETYDRAVREAYGEPAAPDDDSREPGSSIEKWRDVADGADMEAYRPTLLPSMSTWAHITRMADDLSKAVALPKALKGKPADIALVLLAGRDVGVAPTVALNRIHVIDGRPSMAAELMRALVLDRGHDLWFEDVTPTSVTIAGRRKGWPADRVARVTYTLEDAKQAGMITAYDEQTGRVTGVADGKAVWKKFTRNMLKARSTSEWVRDNAPDVVNGVSYTPEELDVEVDADGEPIKVASWSSTAPSAPNDGPKYPTPIDAGWESKEDEHAAHDALADAIKSLGDEHKAKVAEMMDEAAIGARAPQRWPIRPKVKFEAIRSWVETQLRAAPADAEVVATDADDAEVVTGVALDQAPRTNAIESTPDVATVGAKPPTNVDASQSTCPGCGHVDGAHANDCEYKPFG